MALLALFWRPWRLMSCLAPRTETRESTIPDTTTFERSTRSSTLPELRRASTNRTCRRRVRSSGRVAGERLTLEASGTDSARDAREPGLLGSVSYTHLTLPT